MWFSPTIFLYPFGKWKMKTIAEMQKFQKKVDEKDP